LRLPEGRLILPLNPNFAPRDANASSRRAGAVEVRL